jgi:quercetin dioxygenase-like cupin family protein
MRDKFVSVFLTIAALALTASAARAAELDPKAISYTLPENIQWRDNAARTNQSAILYGDPEKTEPYAMLLKWKAGNMSRPHFHPNDRFFVVLSGTWWVGTGKKFDPASTVPLPPGSYVVHYAKGIHYDGAKDGDTVIMVHGMGPATTTPAEEK